MASAPSEAELHGLSLAEFGQMHELCKKAKARAYCVYSHFRVGATLLTTSGNYISGANVENASYPVGSCAERVALGTALTAEINLSGREGGEHVRLKMGDFKALAVATDVGGNLGPTSPCGFCRQALREFCEPSMPIFMFDREGNFAVRTLGELLPMSFGPDALPPPHKLTAYQEGHQENPQTGPFPG